MCIPFLRSISHVHVNKELLLLLFEPFVSTFVHENRGVVMAMIVCSHVSLIHTHVKLDTILYKYSLYIINLTG
jgi:hypothetical protein